MKCYEFQQRHHFRNHVVYAAISCTLLVDLCHNAKDAYVTMGGITTLA